MLCTCCPTPDLLGPLPFSPDIKGRIFHLLLTTTTCNTHFIDLLCLKKAVYARYAKELYREVALDDDNIKALWKGCDWEDDRLSDDESPLLKLLCDYDQPPSHIPISYPSAIRKILLLRHCSSLHLRTCIAAVGSCTVPEQFSSRMRRLGIYGPLFCGIETLSIGEAYMRYLVEEMEDGMKFETSLESIRDSIPQYIPSICIYWPDNAHADLGHELGMALSTETLECHDFIIHNAKLEQLPHLLCRSTQVQHLYLDLAPQVYRQGVDDERDLCRRQEAECHRWVSALVQDLVREDSDDFGTVIFSNMHTWKSPTPNSVVQHDNDIVLSGGWKFFDAMSKTIQEAAVGASPRVQKALEYDWADNNGPLCCDCCAPFVPQGDVDLWRYDYGEGKGVVYDRVPR